MHVHLAQARDTPTEDIGRFFEPASALIDTAAAGGGKVLVHCFEGKSRSVAVVLAYLMLHKARNLAQVSHNTRPKRSDCVTFWESA